MKQGTTTTFKVKQFDLPDITEIIFSFTNDKNNVVVERTTPTTDDGQIHKSYPSEVSLEDGYYKIGLDQDETLKLEETFYVEAQIMFSGAVTKAYIDKVKMPHTFYTKVIDGATTNGEEIELAMELSDVIEIEGGSTGDYTDLTNKPRINNIELIGNKTTSDLGLDIEVGDGLKREDNTMSVDIDANSILEFNNHKLSADTSGLQPTISGGNGIDVSSDVVGVDIASGSNLLDFSSGKLNLSPSVVGQDASVRASLTQNLGLNDELASKSYVDNLVSANLKFEVVQTLPTQDIDTHTIYLVRKSAPVLDNIYDEYMYINSQWELIGTTEVDLSNYYTKAQTYSKTEVDTALGNKQNTLTVGNGIDITSDTISIDISSGSIIDFYNGKLRLLGNQVANDNNFQNTMPYLNNIRQGLLTPVGDYNFQPKLTAGTNITIDSNNVISASGGGLSYTFTDGLTESSGTVGIDLASGSKLLIDSNDKLDIDLSSKQDTIDSTHKLSADLVTDTTATNKFVPTHSSTESGKVLGVDSNGDLEWTTSGGGSYSGGDGIDITNDTISVDIASGSALTITSGELDVDLSSKQDTIDSSHKLSADNVDDTNSTNKFTNATEKQTWNDKADNTTITTDTSSTTPSLTLADNNEYRYTADLTSLTLTMPNGDFIASVVFSSGSTPTSMTYDSSIKWSGDDITNGQFVPQANKDYDIMFYYNGLNINGIVRGVS